MATHWVSREKWAKDPFSAVLYLFSQEAPPPYTPEETYKNISRFKRYDVTPDTLQVLVPKAAGLIGRGADIDKPSTWIYPLFDILRGTIIRFDTDGKGEAMWFLVPPRGAPVLLEQHVEGDGFALSLQSRDGDDYGAAFALALAMAEALRNRPRELVVRKAPPNGVRQRLSAHDHERVITISLSAPVKEYVDPWSAIRGGSREGSGKGSKKCEYEVQPFTRRLRDGRVINVRGHKRGDPNIPRKTTYRIVP